MKTKLLTIVTTTLLLGTAVTYGGAFSVVNNSSNRGIYIEFNQGSASFPSNCTKTTGNSQCCKVNGSDTTKEASFTISSGSFNIAVGSCGSSGLAQAEFNIATSGSCGMSGACDVVDASIVQSSKPTVIISPAGHTPIHTGDTSSCAVQTASSQSNCTKPPAGYNPPATSQCVKNNNYCTNFYKSGGSYTVTFQ